MEEVFRTIEGLEDYQVSNTGRVISNKYGKSTFLKPQKDGIGYFHVRLFPSDDRFGTYGKGRGKKPKLEKVHRLVAMAFLPMPDSKGTWEVNHKDGNKENNDVTNLEWVSRKENIQHSWDIGLRTNAAWKAAPKRYKAVMVTTPDGEVSYYQSRKHAAMDLGITVSNVNHFVKRAKPSYKGKIKGYLFQDCLELPPSETFKQILNIEQKLLEYKKFSDAHTLYARERRKKLNK